MRVVASEWTSLFFVPAGSKALSCEPKRTSDVIRHFNRVLVVVILMQSQKSMRLPQSLKILTISTSCWHLDLQKLQPFNAAVEFILTLSPTV